MRSYLVVEPYCPDRGDCRLPIVLEPRPALFRCLQCSHKWQAKSGPCACSRCGHAYLRWLDYAPS